MDAGMNAFLAVLFKIAAGVGGLIVGVTGVLGFGRSAWKIAQGDPDAWSTLLASIFALGVAAVAQAYAATMSGGFDLGEVREVAAHLGAAVFGVVGVAGLGRAAWQFAHGEDGAVQALVWGIVGLACATLAAVYGSTL